MYALDVLGMCCLYFGVFSCDRDMRNIMLIYYLDLSSCIVKILCLYILYKYYDYILSAKFKKNGQTCSYSLEAFNKGKRAVTAQNKGSFAIDM